MGIKHLLSLVYYSLFPSLSLSLSLPLSLSPSLSLSLSVYSSVCVCVYLCTSETSLIVITQSIDMQSCEQMNE